MDKDIYREVLNSENKIFKTYVFDLHNKQIKIGVIGLTTVETYSSTS
jgi:hypothetical protein